MLGHRLIGGLAHAEDRAEWPGLIDYRRASVAGRAAVLEVKSLELERITVRFGGIRCPPDSSLSDHQAYTATTSSHLFAWMSRMQQSQRSHRRSRPGRRLEEMNGRTRGHTMSFYAERTGFSLFSFLKSPMILMALVSGVMIFGMPYLMDNMDPETKAEFEEMQKKSPMTGSQGAGAQMQNFDFAGWMAGKGAGAEGGSSGGGSKRR
ncbi:hypothetical protein KC356_g141 [Hortaea werneckii]|nr:hypothetical protein KC356_g141 [Hortaea werneckii]